MNKPTDEQIKEFWEKLGFVDTFEGDTGAYYWKAPNGDAGVDLPPIDLNNLFRYAVPKLLRSGYNSIYLEPHNRIGDNEVYISYKCTIWSDCGGGMKSVSGNDPALALFWAIYEVMK